jgi:hypothetical protein
MSQLLIIFHTSFGISNLPFRAPEGTPVKAESLPTVVTASGQQYGDDK